MKHVTGFIKKHMFWICVGLFIAGLYGYGFYVRHNTEKALKYSVRAAVESFGLPADVLSDEVWEKVDNAISQMIKATSPDNFKESDMWNLMTVPDRIKIYIAWGTKKTMPIIVVAIILMAIVLRTRYSATIDIYSAAREAEINKYRQSAQPTVEVIDSKEQVQEIMQAPAVEVKSEIDSTTQMNTF